MEKPRFSPERYNPQVVLLQKEIYRKEEKYLGLKLLSEKERFEKFIRVLKPKFSGLLKDNKKHNLSFTDNISEGNTSKSQYLHERGKSVVKDCCLYSYQQAKVTNRTWDKIHSSNAKLANDKDKTYSLLKKVFKTRPEKGVFY